MRARKRLDRAAGNGKNGHSDVKPTDVKPIERDFLQLLSKEERKAKIHSIIAAPLDLTNVAIRDHLRAQEIAANLEGDFANQNIPQFQDNRTYQIIIAGTGAKEELQRLLSGEIPELEEHNGEVSE